MRIIITEEKMEITELLFLFCVLAGILATTAYKQWWSTTLQVSTAYSTCKLKCFPVNHIFLNTACLVGQHGTSASVDWATLQYLTSNGRMCKCLNLPHLCCLTYKYKNTIHPKSEDTNIIINIIWFYAVAIQGRWPLKD